MLQPRKQLEVMYVPALFEEPCETQHFYRLDGLYQNQLLIPILQTTGISGTRLYSTPIDHPVRTILVPLDLYAGRLILDMELCELAKVACRRYRKIVMLWMRLHKYTRIGTAYH